MMRWKTLGKITASLVFAIYVGSFGYNNYFKPEAPHTLQVVHPPIKTAVKPVGVSDIDPAILLGDTNKHRIANSLVPVTTNALLTQSAQAKCNDMVTRDYWSHNTPDGQEPWVFMIQAGYSYRLAGENLSYGYKNASEIVVGWINSPSHNENLLQPKFREIGFGICLSESFTGNPNLGKPSRAIIVVQHFAEPF